MELYLHPSYAFKIILYAEWPKIQLTCLILTGMCRFTPANVCKAALHCCASNMEELVFNNICKLVNKKEIYSVLTSCQACGLLFA
jgi:hypothetical protein